MRYLSTALKMVVVLAAVGGCALMAGRLGMWRTMGLWAVIWGILCAGLAVALSRQTSGRVTVVNYLAGYVLQWGYRLGRGKLLNIALISWSLWMLLGAAAVLAMQVHANTFAAATTGEPQPRSALVMTLLVLAWIIDGAALFYLLGVLFSGGNSGRQISSLGPVMAALLLMIGSSVGLVWFNPSATAARVALLLAGGPVLLVGLLYGVFVVVIVVCGRKARWN